ncbi:MAG: efflux RND transporter periplasmic adaptor subunit [Thermodesulfobacteriota bacterium]
MKTMDSNDTADRKKMVLPRHPPGSGNTWRRRLLWTVIVLCAVAFVARFVLGRDRDPVEYTTSEARRGDLTVIVTATGRLQPTNQVDVGSEVSGTIATVPVDYNDVVTAGQVLARLDTSRLEAQVSQARAALESARANLRQVEATVVEVGLEMDRLLRLRQLSGGKLPSGQELDAAEAALRRARAGEAVARATIAEAEARLHLNQTDLEKATIISPVNGVVLVRSAEPGQTVAASLQAPVLFTLAEDLTRMELHVDVDEADVGQVHEGQQATFTVDAYPDRTFPAHITQVRYGAQSSEGVVTYLTVLNVDNSDLSLRPGMTATADIVVKEVRDALLVSNAALRFAPPRQEKGNATRSGGSLLLRLFPRPGVSGGKKSDEAGGRHQQRVWTLRNGEPVAVPVTTGATSGIMTEIIDGEVTAGMPLVVEAVSRGK